MSAASGTVRDEVEAKGVHHPSSRKPSLSVSSSRHSRKASVSSTYPSRLLINEGDENRDISVFQLESPFVEDMSPRSCYYTDSENIWNNDDEDAYSAVNIHLEGIPPLDARTRTSSLEIPRPGSFRDILQHSTKFDLLRAFASEEYKEDNVLFYLACSKFELEGESTETNAINIYRIYLSPHALFDVSVDKAEARNIMQALAQQKIHSKMFDYAKKMALVALEEDTYKRFALTTTGRALRDLPETNSPVSETKITSESWPVINNSSVLKRSFYLATSMQSGELNFTEALHKEFCLLAPEAQALFLQNSSHQGVVLVSAISNFLTLLKNGQDARSVIRSLTEVHISFGVTRSMFRAFGEALISTLHQFLELDANSLEWEAIARHWQVVYELLTRQLIHSMIQMGPYAVLSTSASSSLAKKLPEFKTLAIRCVELVKPGNPKFAQVFLQKFGPRSPLSVKKYENATSQSKCLWGALNSVVTMLEKPDEFCRVLMQVSSVHRARGVTWAEFNKFLNALRDTFRSELGEVIYTEEMDQVWKRSLELCELFLEDTPAGVTQATSLRSPSANSQTQESNEFRTLMSNPDTFHAFKLFSQTEFSEEHVLFYQACTKYHLHAKKQNHSEMLAAAQHIFTLYLQPTSLFHVGLTNVQIKSIAEAIHTHVVTPDTFESAKHIALYILERDLYPRFMQRARTTPEHDSEAIKKSLLLSRSFELATAFAKKKSFAETFYQKLFIEAPETKPMFQHDVRHQTAALQGSLTNLLFFLKQPSKQYLTVVKRLSKIHLQMGITKNMFEAFGIALVKTLKDCLNLEEKSLEWAALESHWRVAYRLISTDILSSMSAVPKLFSKSRAMPKWVQEQSDTYVSYTQLTIQLVSKRGEEAVMEAFYSKFFELSPGSSSRFKSLSHQVKALWGAIKTVSKLLKEPTKMRKTLAKLAKLHRGKNIEYKEYELFARALRLAFRSELGTQYTAAVDAVWKQFLDLCTQFLAEKPATLDSKNRIEYDDEQEFSLSGHEGDSTPTSSSSSVGGGGEIGEVVERRSRRLSLGLMKTMITTIPMDESDSRNIISPREHHFVNRIFAEPHSPSLHNLPKFFDFLHQCPRPKRLNVLNQYFITCYHHSYILEELLQQNQWKLWLLPLSRPAAGEPPEANSAARTRLMEYVILIVVEVFFHFFQCFDPKTGELAKKDGGTMTVEFERRGKDASMTDFLLDAISYLSLLHPRDIVSRFLFGFITKIGAWPLAAKPQWVLPDMEASEWPNLFAILAAIEEYLFFSNHKEKSALIKDTVFCLGTGLTSFDLVLVEAICNLLQKLKFGRWIELPENDAKLQKLKRACQAKGQRTEQFFVGVRDFFKLVAAGQATRPAVPGFVTLLLSRKRSYGTKHHVERVVARFIEEGASNYVVLHS